MVKYILKRLLRGVVTLITFQSLLFGLIQILPYDFTTFMILSPQSRRWAQNTLGLNEAWWKQYLHWLTNFFQLDLGKSFLAWPTPVSEILLGTAPSTLVLFLTASILAYLLGMWLGKLIAWNRGGWLEFSLTLGGVASYTSFAPFLAFVLLNIFGRYLGWFPYQRLVNHNVWFDSPVTISYVLTWIVGCGIVSAILFGLTLRFTNGIQPPITKWGLRGLSLLLIAGGIWATWNWLGHGRLALDILYHLVLPLTSVVLLSFGETMLLMRTTMLELLNEKYVLMARAKGLPQRIIRDKHVARNAFMPVLTRLILNLPFVITGSLAIEIIFNWRAMGITVFQAIEFQDIPLLMGTLSVVGVLVLIGHILLDILHVYMDPRLRNLESSEV